MELPLMLLNSIRHCCCDVMHMLVRRVRALFSDFDSFAIRFVRRKCKSTQRNRRQSHVQTLCYFPRNFFPLTCCRSIRCPCEFLVLYIFFFSSRFDPSNGVTLMWECLEGGKTAFGWLPFTTMLVSHHSDSRIYTYPGMVWVPDACTEYIGPCTGVQASSRLCAPR